MTDPNDPGLSFLGTGWSFPPAFSARGTDVATVSGVEDVHQSLNLLLRTRTGERPIHDTYGCDLHNFLFEDVDHNLVGRIATLVSNAIREHEPRVALHGVDVRQSAAEPGRLSIHIDYTVVGTNSRYNMVFPFAINEAAQPLRFEP